MMKYWMIGVTAALTLLAVQPIRRPSAPVEPGAAYASAEQPTAH